jgi:uncharacterized protein YdbL (DUF1318 family)
MNGCKSMLLLCLLPLFAMAADDVNVIQARMAERLPSINKMKNAQAVGEDNAGFLHVLKDDQAGTALIKAENKDRKQVYELIAGQTGATAEVVGKRRALHIAKRSASGVMIQDTKGKWAPKS